MSSLSALTSSSSVNPFQQIRQDFQALGTALQSGNLSGAQSAMSGLQQAQQSLPLPPSSIVSLQGANSSTGSSAVASGMATLASDLQFGNLSAAQSVYQQIQSQMQSAQGAGHHGGHGGHHGGGIGALLGASSSSSSSSGTSSGSVLDSLLNSLSTSSSVSGSISSTGSTSPLQTAFAQLIQSLQNVESALGNPSGSSINVSA